MEIAYRRRIRFLTGVAPRFKSNSVYVETGKKQAKTRKSNLKPKTTASFP